MMLVTLPRTATLGAVARTTALLAALPLLLPPSATARGGRDATVAATRTYDARLTSPSARRNLSFGLAQALHGAHAIVGAPGANRRAGAAFVFARSGDGFGAATRLVAEDRVRRAQFGWAVDIEGDTAVVGALGADGDPGAVYVFGRTDEGWQQEAKLVASDAAPDARFGWAVSLSGDTIAVGAPGANDRSGAAYVFRHDGASWIEEQSFTGAAGSALGWSVALDQDVLFLGAPLPDGGRGRGMVFEHDGDAWGLATELAGENADDAFGVGADLDGDTLIVGAEDADVGAHDSGAAHVFVRDAEGWRSEGRLAAASPSEDARFGLRVAVSGDVAVIGAPTGRSPIDGEETGTAYVFLRRDGRWAEAATLVAESGPEDAFGYVAIDGRTVLVGAPLHDEPRQDAGAVYVYEVADVGLGTPPGPGPDRESGVQRSPDGSRVLISKDVSGALGVERWAIVRDLGDETIIGNVFPADGSAPAFVFCRPLLREEDEVALECAVADPCTASPCLATDWRDVGSVRVPASFLELPPA